MNSTFLKAQPIWVEGKQREVNCRIQFKAICSKTNNAAIRIATSGIYQLYINGEFVSYGPARAGKNHFRMEDIDISSYLKLEKNIIILEVAGYYCTNFYVMRQESFLQAEIVSENKVLAATGFDFSARKNPYYIQKVQRYSYQRTFVESYQLKKDDFLVNEDTGNEKIAVLNEKNIISRTVDYPNFETINAECIRSGIVEIEPPKEYKYDRYFLQVGFKDGQNTGWNSNLLDSAPEKDWQEFKFIAKENPSININANGYSDYQFSHNATGMIKFNVKCESKVTLYLIFDEIMTDEINPKRARNCNIVKYQLEAGEYNLQTFEVYTMKYLKIVSIGADCSVENLSLVEYKHPYIEIPKFEDEKLQLIAKAAVETFRQNAVDILTDCPSRERAGWLCDSFFLARAEYILTGKNIVEEAFLENYLHEEVYEKLPDGMVPMCYPADHPTGWYIPNWAMWLIVELHDYYINRNGNIEFINKFKEKIYGILKYFENYENSDGLLENLDSWVFVEWSRANDTDMTKGINYPSNMLYYASLKAAAELYDDNYLYEKSENLKSKINEQSFGGEFYYDRAIRTANGIFAVPESTEVCQYYAFFCGVATDKTHNELLKTLINDFGPNRDMLNVYPEIHKAAPFIGNYLRLDILKNYGYSDEVTKNIKDYFYYMATKTGTLWEKAETTASCNHGFASCVLYLMI